MAKIIIERNATSRKYSDKAEVRQIGKAGRMARMFAKSRKINQACENAVEKESRVDTAIKFSGNRQAEKLIDVANYNYLKGAVTVNTVRATQKRRLGVRELIR